LKVKIKLLPREKDGSVSLLLCGVRLELEEVRVVILLSHFSF